MILKYFFLVISILCCLNNVAAQQAKEYKPVHILSIGSRVPDVEINNLINYPGTHARLSALESKLLIIDFWATWCSSCTAAFPKLKQLQKDIPGVNLLLVTKESAQTVNQFNRRRHRFGKDIMSFISTCNDKLLNRLFPNDLIPHYVWIKKGIVQAITSSDEVTAANARKMLRSSNTILTVKDDASVRLHHDFTKPLFLNGNGGTGDKVVWYSVLSARQNSIQNVALLLCGRRQGFIQLPNTSILSFYQFAYGDDEDFFEQRLPASRIIIDTQFNKRLADTTQYCYNLVTPHLTPQALKKCMQEDVKRYFGINASWRSKVMDCLVLTCEDSSLLQPLPIDSVRLINHPASPYHFISLNNPFNLFVRELREGYLFYSTYPIIDETHIKGNVYFSIEADMRDWQSINGALAKYKVHLAVQKREIRVLVIGDPGSP